MNIREEYVKERTKRALLKYFISVIGMNRVFNWFSKRLGFSLEEVGFTCQCSALSIGERFSAIAQIIGNPKALKFRYLEFTINTEKEVTKVYAKTN